jgi:hypothetical protein
MRSRVFVIGAALLVGACAAPIPRARAQTIPFSQRATLSQSVGFTQISIDYGRPVARGRTLFPDVVNWERVWNPGADSATRVSFSRNVTLNGKELAAGEYTIWLIPRDKMPWTLILHRAAHVFHTPYPGDEGVALRLEVAPEGGEHMEALAIYFPAVVKDSAVMRIHWGKLVLPVSIKAPYRPDGDNNAGGYRLSNDFGNIMWTPTLPSTSWVMLRSAAMLDS